RAWRAESSMSRTIWSSSFAGSCIPSMASLTLDLMSVDSLPRIPMAASLTPPPIRCYRPAMRLADVTGQQRVVDGLLRAVAAGHVPHAYLFEGPPGVGKRATALGLAMALTCPKAPGRGCGVCETCRRIDAGIHPDVPTFAPDGPQLVIEQAK